MFSGNACRPLHYNVHSKVINIMYWVPSKGSSHGPSAESGRLGNSPRPFSGC